MKTAEELQALKDIRIEDYTYDLPDGRIARFPLECREQSKLLHFRDGEITPCTFADVRRILPPDATLVFNNTRVIHARLFFRKSTGAVIEIFCLEPHTPADYALNFSARGTCIWNCLVGNLKKWKDGFVSASFTHDGKEYTLTASKESAGGESLAVRFDWDAALSFSEVLESCGKIPIPPYLNRESDASDETRYQTVYSRAEGSVAAPTAGLHFTRPLLDDLRARGIRTCELTLHVGAGTFRPVKSATIGGHDMHTEHLIITRPFLVQLLDAPGALIAVGTTSVRTLESLYWMGVKRLTGAASWDTLSQWEAYTLPDTFSLREALQALVAWFDETGETHLKARTTIIILPGYRFRVIRALFTNFHQPQSTLLLLVAAAVGRDWRRIYDYALANGFRFLSYGDSNLLYVNPSPEY